MVGRKRTTRVAVLTVATIAWLVPSLASPARTLYLPTTLARTVTLSPGDRLARLDFRPTHIAFSWTGDEGTGVRYRTTSLSGHVSRWQRAPEAHDAERGDHRFSAVLAVGHPTKVEYEPIRPRDKTMGPVTLDYLNTIDGPLRTVRVPLVAEAAAEDPDIVTRREWGADESLKKKRGGCTRRFFDLQQMFVHHTAGKNNDRNPAATMRAIYWYHTVRQGWCDVGYNFVIAPDGTIFEGRWARKYGPWEIHSSEDLSGRVVTGAHVSGFNSGSVGVSLMGNFSRIKAPPAARQSLAELLAWEADRHDLAPRGRHLYVNPETGRRKWLPTIAGHRDAGSTACPGGLLYRSLPGVRADTAAVMGDGKVSTTLSMVASSPVVTSGQSAELSGSLGGTDGLGLFNASITLYQRRPRGQWRVGGQTVTGLDGSFRFTITPPSTVISRAVFMGDSTRWGSQTANVKVRVIAPASPSPTPTGL
jgi:hypothetical protein